MIIGSPGSLSGPSARAPAPTGGDIGIDSSASMRSTSVVTGNSPIIGAMRATMSCQVGTAFHPDVYQPCVSGIAIGLSSIT